MLIPLLHDALNKIGLGYRQVRFDRISKDGPSLILGTLQRTLP